MKLIQTEQRVSTFAAVVAKLDIGSEYFWNVERLVPFEHWVGHIPFAFWIIKALRPKLIVELGAHRGNSYCAMCQAVSSLSLSTQALAVDTWEGDVHMNREEGLLEDLRTYHDPRYADFSTLMQMTFDEARPHVDDQSVDLLHIDGCHTYEAARHDFENWKATLSTRGVVMFHDTMVRREQYGVWRLWKELASEYPSFEFRHSYGLGVLSVGTEQEPLLRELFAIGKDEVETHQVRSLFAARGEAHVARLLASQTTQQLREHEKRWDGMSEAVSAQRTALHEERRVAEARETEHARLIEIERQVAEARETEHARLIEIERQAMETRENDHAQLIEIERASMHMRETVLRGSITAERDAAYKALVATREAEATTAAAVADLVRLRAIEASTIWRMTRLLDHVPPPVRRLGRRGLKAGWWTVTGQLLERLRQRRTALTTIAAQSTAIASVRVPDPAVSVQRLPSPAKIEFPNLQSCRIASPRARLAVVMHVHFADLLPELEQALSAMPESFDLYASVTADAGEVVAAAIRTRYADSHVYVFPNHGRDILPFLAFAQTGALSNYKLVLKLHTKRSLHTENGDAWRQDLVKGILESPERIQQILDVFEADPDLGIVVADDNICGDDPGHWRDSREAILRLGARIGIRSIPENARFPAGSIYWIRPFLLRTLSGMNVTPIDFEAEPLSLDGSAAHAVERLIGLVCADAGMVLRTTSAVLQATPVALPAKQSTLHLIAYYLPQFHPVPENNKWWGEGFTEWTNVTRATPSFSGHRQPRLPADLGFYDLRIPEVREAQATLARQYGIGAFCYYYYWFDGRGMLRQPLDDMLASGRPDFPFLICWANEPWTRNWDGGTREVLLQQTYLEGWPEAFARDIAPTLRDPRYFRLGGLPLLLIYRVMHIPEREMAFRRLRKELQRLGVGEVHLSGGWVGFGDEEALPSNPGDLGLDDFFEFPPHRLSATEISGDIEGLDPEFTGHIFDYNSAIETSLAESTVDDNRHHAVMLGWDNTARNMRRAHAYHGATPAKFRRWLRGILRLERSREDAKERLVFINAWNEWAEGTYLEPDREFGRGWLEAVASAASEPILPVQVLAKEIPLSASSAGLTDEEWLQRVIAKAEGRAGPGVEELPPFPAPVWQAQFVGSSNAHAMWEAFTFYKLIKAKATAHGVPIQRSTRVLDFGCGWGRYVRLWMKDIAPDSLYGVDVDPDMIGFCRISGLPAQFMTIPPFGPTAFPTESFDLIFAYSVFSHLAEPAYNAWMTEFGRILRPGGMVVFTTQARRFLEGTVLLSEKLELSGWERSLQTAFPDIEKTIATYDRGDFVFAATGGGDHRPSDFYGEAAIPSLHLERTAGGFGLRLVEFIDDPLACPQAVAIVVKPTA